MRPLPPLASPVSRRTFPTARRRPRLALLASSEPVLPLGAGPVPDRTLLPAALALPGSARRGRSRPGGPSSNRWRGGLLAVPGRLWEDLPTGAQTGVRANAAAGLRRGGKGG